MGQSQELKALQRRVEGWRRDGGGRGSRIPEDMWRAAVALARTQGTWSTARTLRFNYERLKKLVGRGRAGKRATEFVAVDVMPPTRGLKVVVEFAGGDGEQMRMDVSGATAADVVALASAYWRRRS